MLITDKNIYHFEEYIMIARYKANLTTIYENANIHYTLQDPGAFRRIMFWKSANHYENSAKKGNLLKNL